MVIVLVSLNKIIINLQKFKILINKVKGEWIILEMLILIINNNNYNNNNKHSPKQWIKYLCISLKYCKKILFHLHCSQHKIIKSYNKIIYKIIDLNKNKKNNQIKINK